MDHIFVKQINALVENHLSTLFNATMTKVNKVTRIKWKMVLKIDLSIKVLPVRILKAVGKM